jgi:hypothetical protein
MFTAFDGRWEDARSKGVTRWWTLKGGGHLGVLRLDGALDKSSDSTGVGRPCGRVSREGAKNRKKEVFREFAIPNLSRLRVRFLIL